MGNTEVYVCNILWTNGSNNWGWKTVKRLENKKTESADLTSLSGKLVLEGN